MRVLVSSAALLILMIATAGAHPRAGDDGSTERVERAVARLATAAGGVVGVSATHLESGRHLSFRGTERFPMASTYKFPIALRVLDMADRGELRLDESVTLAVHDYRPGWSPLADVAGDSPTTLSLRRLLELMLVDSDNSACDALLRRVGGPHTVTTRLRARGVTGIDVSRYEAQFFTDSVGIRTLPPESEWTVARLEDLAQKVSPEDRKAADDRFADDPRDTAQPDSMVELLARAYRGETVSRGSTALVFDLLTKSTTGVDRIKGLLIAGTVVAHKSGLQGGSTNDIGIITLPDAAGHVALAIYVKGSEKTVAERARAIAEIARTIYDYYVVAGPLTNPTSRRLP